MVWLWKKLHGGIVRDTGDVSLAYEPVQLARC